MGAEVGHQLRKRNGPNKGSLHSWINSLVTKDLRFNEKRGINRMNQQPSY